MSHYVKTFHALETCDTVDEAVDRLRSTPVAIPQNVTLVDPHRTLTVHVGPGIPLTEAPGDCAANHQDQPVPDEQERFTRTRERLAGFASFEPGVRTVTLGRP